MSALSLFYAALFYIATAVLLIGLTYKIRQYARAPAPLRIALTPAPLTPAGVPWRLAREVVFFESLFRANKWTWLFGWVFHAALVLVLLRHVRYFQEPVWYLISLIQPLGTYAGFALVAGLLVCREQRIRARSGSEHLLQVYVRPGDLDKGLTP
mgnify:CR=1 FL=1